MIAAEFSRYADELIAELAPQLPDVAAQFHKEHGRGVVQLEMHDADQPADRTTSITYHPLEKWPVGSHPRHLVSEYDPVRELILHVVIDEMALTRRLRFSELRH